MGWLIATILVSAIGLGVLFAWETDRLSRIRSAVEVENARRHEELVEAVHDLDRTLRHGDRER